MTTISRTFTVSPAPATVLAYLSDFSHAEAVITYEATIEMKRAARLATPLVKLVFEKIGSDTAEDMTRVINQLP